MNIPNPEVEKAIGDAAQKVLGGDGLIDDWVLSFTWIDLDGTSHVRSIAHGSKTGIVGMTSFAYNLANQEMMKDVQDLG